jgi:DNA polymerase elongation subunit (family B)
MVAARDIIFKAQYWDFENEDDKIIIHIGGLTKDNETVHVKVEEFKPFVYVELPSKGQYSGKFWNANTCNTFVEYAKKTMKHGPIKHELKCLFLLQYKLMRNCIKLYFDSSDASKDFARRWNFAKNDVTVQSDLFGYLGTFKPGEIKVHEHNIDPVIQFTALKKLKLSGWIHVKEYIKSEFKNGKNIVPVEERVFSTCDIDCYTLANNVTPYDEASMKKYITRPKYISFDLECYSKNHNSKLPDPKIPENKIFMIGNTIGRLTNKETTHILLTIYDTLPIENTEIILCKSEKELLLKFAELIRNTDPDIFIGYNILKFDWNYIIERAELLGIYSKFAKFDRLISKSVEVKKVSWSSGAYGQQDFKYIERKGTIQLDVLCEVERNFKFPKYTLQYVSEYFLKESKDDVSALQMFILINFLDECCELINRIPAGLLSKKAKAGFHSLFETLIPLSKSYGILADLRKELFECETSEQLKDFCKKIISIIGHYCVVDTQLPVKLCDKLNLYTSMSEMSNCMNVPMSYLHTRGQQIKVLAQVYRETITSSIIIPYKGKEKIADDKKYQGAIVIEANKGHYSNVNCFDFESLYPTVMIAYNICYTTITSKDDPVFKGLTKEQLAEVLKRDYNVLTWEEHVGCSHDPKKRSAKQKKNPTCEIHYYIFKKVKILPDGTRLHEGLMPKIERNLLSERKVVKKEMNKLQATLDMHLGKSMPKDIENFKKWGYTIIEKNSLSKEQQEILEVGISVLNAQQLALKVSANSVAPNTPIPCLVDNIFKYLTIEELSLANTHRGGNCEWDKTSKDEKDMNQVSKPIPNLQVWSDKGWSNVKYVMRHPPKDSLVRVTTHSGSVDCTREHSLLNDEGEKVRPLDLKIGNRLLHDEIPTYELSQYDTQSFGNTSKLFSSFYNNLDNISQGNYPYYTTKNRIDANKFINCARSFGLNISIKEENEEYTIFYSKNEFKNQNEIIKIQEITDKYDYVYDIETDSHHFAAGVGDLIVHNSAYGAMGAKTGIIPLIPGAASVTAMGRFLIMAAIKFILGKYPQARLVYGDTDSSMITFVNSLKDMIISEETNEKVSKINQTISNLKDMKIKCKSDNLVYALREYPKKYLDDLTDIERENWYKVRFYCKSKDEWYTLKEYPCEFIDDLKEEEKITWYQFKDAMESFELGDKISKETTHFLKSHMLGKPIDFTLYSKSKDQSFTLDKYPRDLLNDLCDDDKVLWHTYDSNPINLQFENLYKSYLLLTKKRYMAYAVNREGEIRDVIKKGVVLSRRDNSLYLREGYRQASSSILDNKSENQVLNIIYDEVHKLFTRQFYKDVTIKGKTERVVDFSNLIIYTGVKNVISYATREKDEEGNEFYVDANKNKIKVSDITDPLDSRLVYRNLPQALLSLKMIRRGEEIPPNTRLEYLYLENDQAIHQGEKAEDYTFFKENKSVTGSNMKPDYIHYIEKQLMKPMHELISVKYRNSSNVVIIPYRNLEKYIPFLISKLNMSSEKTSNGNATMYNNIIGLKRFNEISKTISVKVCKAVFSYKPQLKNGYEMFNTKDTHSKDKFIPQISCIVDKKDFQDIQNEKRIQFSISHYKLNDEKKYNHYLKTVKNMHLQNNKNEDDIEVTYKSKGRDPRNNILSSQVDYILESVRVFDIKKELNKTQGIKFNRNNYINPDRIKYKELVQCCRRWKAANILSRRLKQFGQSRKIIKTPVSTKEKLRIKTKIVLDQEIKDPNTGIVYKKMTRGRVLNMIKKEKPEKVKTNRKKLNEEDVYDFFYDIVLKVTKKNEPKVILKDVPRIKICPILFKDSTIMKDILGYRSCFKNVVDELNTVLEPLEFVCDKRIVTKKLKKEYGDYLSKFFTRDKIRTFRAKRKPKAPAKPKKPKDGVEKIPRMLNPKKK